MPTRTRSTRSPLRVGVIGTTAYAETHMRRVKEHPQAVLTAIAGRDRTRAEAVGATHHVPQVYAGYEELIGAGEVDALIVVAPDDLHEPIAIAAFGAGIHVLCEKPLASTPQAARRMMDAADASGLVNMSYFALRTSAHHRHLRQLVAEGLIGEVRTANFTLAHGFFRSPEYNWRFDASRGGGVVSDLGCYLFDLARWYVGEVRSVAAHGAGFVHRPHPDGTTYATADDSCVGALVFETGAHATFEVSVLSHIGAGAQRNTVHLQGETGRLELTHTFAGSELRYAPDDGGDFAVLDLPGDLAAPSGDAEFIDAVLADVQVLPRFADGWRVQQIVAAAEAAAHSNNWVDVKERTA
ncbi:Gfo/Idh/MocA family protein [Micromonospora sp. DT81.3]|uniref:Gfo/Idh/MocA family protein n=1 Tax=Micromonospora sp. DT81.3 TaxID=3416523 RepID=UPI003CEB0CEB